jgi:hypothetical protein
VSAPEVREKPEGDGANSPTRTQKAPKFIFGAFCVKRLAQMAFFGLPICFLAQKSRSFKFICILAR